MAKSLKVVFLGGVGEIGKNMTALEYGENIIIIDIGMSFPTEDTPGIDVVVPDVTYLSQNKEKIKGIFITHGHEDHVGGVSYLWPELGCPTIYGTPFSLAIARHKIEESGLPVKNMKEVNAGDVVNVDCFKVEFIKVCHSIAEASALSITTPVGVVFVTGDFKIDFTPIDNKLTDLERIGEIGKKGVLLMLGESTNVERNGHTMSERTVGESFDVIFGKNQKKRMIVATFSTNNYRLQQLMDISVKYNRKVVLSGRSMKNIVDMAAKLNELTFPKDLIVDIDKANKLPPERVTILCTGSQGEPMSALSRMSQGTFDKVTISATDTVVISATPIPGNERGVYNVVNNLYKLGADVIYNPSDDIHVSGHACKEELKLMLSLVRPKFFIPVHGEQKHLRKHAALASSMGIEPSNIIIADNGKTIEASENAIKVAGEVTSGMVFVDGTGVGDVGSVVLRDRTKLAEDGIVIIVLSMDGTTGDVVSGPEVITRGFVYVRESEQMLDQTRRLCEDVVADCMYDRITDHGTIKNRLRDAVSKHIYQTTRRSPMVLPIIMEV